MGWFDRSRGNQDAAQAFALLANVVREVRAVEIIGRSCGRYGLRRFLLRFELKSGRMRITGLETERLRNGGPPDPVAFDAAATSIERMLGDLRQRLPANFQFQRGALGVLRDESGPVSLFFRFNEDADSYGLLELRLPKGTGSPVEDVAYLNVLERWAARINPVRARWLGCAAHERWAMEQGRLKLGAHLERTFPAEPVATWVPHTGDFSWMVANPVGDEPPFVQAEMILEMGAALELVAFAAARMGGTGVFQGTLEKPAGMQIFIALKDK